MPCLHMVCLCGFQTRVNLPQITTYLHAELPPVSAIGDVYSRTSCGSISTAAIRSSSLQVDMSLWLEQQCCPTIPSAHQPEWSDSSAGLPSPLRSVLVQPRLEARSPEPPRTSLCRPPALLLAAPADAASRRLVSQPLKRHLHATTEPGQHQSERRCLAVHSRCWHGSSNGKHPCRVRTCRVIRPSSSSLSTA
jgi:hypothetical protein